MKTIGRYIKSRASVLYLFHQNKCAIKRGKPHVDGENETATLIPFIPTSDFYFQSRIKGLLFKNR